MLELIQESILPVNLPFTILLGAIAAYWIIGLCGLVDLEGMDGIGGGGEGDGLDGLGEGGNGDVAGDNGGDGHGGGVLHAVMKIVGASDAPLIFVISLFGVFLWILNVTGNHYYNPGFDGGRATLILLPVVVGSLVLTRLLLIPLRPVIKMLKTSEEPAQIIGAGGVVRSASLDAEFGEVEIETSGKNIILRAKISDGSESLKKGHPILVVSKEENSDTYVVRSLH